MKTMPIKAVFFDLDGTLLDTFPDFEFVLNQLLTEENKLPVAPEDIRATVSNGARALVTLGFGVTEGDQAFEPLSQRLLNLYSRHLADNSRPFPGINELLAKITEHNLSWGVVTNKPLAYARPLLQALNLQPDTLICPDHVKVKKPDPEALHLACQEINCSEQEALYIGDHLRDILCGKNAGMKTIAAAYGYIKNEDEARQWNADHIANTAYDLWPLIETYL